MFREWISTWVICSGIWWATTAMFVPVVKEVHWRGMVRAQSKSEVKREEERWNESQRGTTVSGLYRKCWDGGGGI